MNTLSILNSIAKPTSSQACGNILNATTIMKPIIAATPLTTTTTTTNHFNNSGFTNKKSLSLSTSYSTPSTSTEPIKLNQVQRIAKRVDSIKLSRQQHHALEIQEFENQIKDLKVKLEESKQTETELRGEISNLNIVQKNQTLFSNKEIKIKVDQIRSLELVQQQQKDQSNSDIGELKLQINQKADTIKNNEQEIKGLKLQLESNGAASSLLSQQYNNQYNNDQALIGHLKNQLQLNSILINDQQHLQKNITILNNQLNYIIGHLKNQYQQQLVDNQQEFNGREKELIVQISQLNLVMQQHQCIHNDHYLQQQQEQQQDIQFNINDDDEQMDELNTELIHYKQLSERLEIDFNSFNQLNERLKLEIVDWRKKFDDMDDSEKAFINGYEVRWQRNISIINSLYNNIIEMENRQESSEEEDDEKYSDEEEYSHEEGYSDEYSDVSSSSSEN